MEKKALYAGVLSILLALITEAPFIYGTYYFLLKMPDISFMTAVAYLTVILFSPLVVPVTFMILGKIYYELIYGKE